MKIIILFTLLFSFASCKSGAPSAKKSVSNTVGTSIVSSDDTEFSNVSASTRFVYRVNTNLNTISVASVDLSDGSLTDHPAISTGVNSAPKAIIANSSNTYMYVANSGTGIIGLYSIDQATGNLTWVANKSTYPEPTLMVLHPNGQYLYTLHSNNSQLTTHTIALDGTLTHAFTTTVFGAGAKGLAIDTTGKVIYASSTSWMKTFVVNVATGELTYSGNQTGNIYITIKNNPGSNRFYMPTIYSSIWGFDFDATGNFATGTSNTPNLAFLYNDITFTSDGLNAYAVNGFKHQLEHYSVNPATGRTTYVDGMTLPTGCEPKTVHLLENDSFIFTTCSDGSGKTISYELDGSGNLSGSPKTSIISGAVINHALVISI